MRVNNLKERSIRVFISSTFKDMMEEREELIKRVFPQLRKLCEERHVTWGEVDLRWGVTNEQAAEGKVLPICLEEIKNCWPYFIGILGERYGWVPDEIPQEVIEREPWLQEHIQDKKSVTELEILKGVLNNPDMEKSAFFYFRDPRYIDSIPEDKRSDYEEIATKDEIGKYGHEEAERLAGKRRVKLFELKFKIMENEFPVQGYYNPEELGKMVLEDLTKVIDELYPEEEIPEPLDRDAMDHEAFAESRRGVYIGRDEYFDQLDKHVAGDGPPLVVLGESGSGKSALLANWTKHYAYKHADAHMLIHFIGSSSYSSDWSAMLRRIMGELKRRFDIQGDIPDKPDELRMAFANWLHMAAAKGKIIIVLDALNQLEDRDQAPDLVWLPPEIPDNIRMILSTLPGRPLDDLTKREWPTMEINLLNDSERRKLIVKFLKSYTKSLEDNPIDRIIDAKQTSNPLYLIALLDELRQWGDHFTVNKRIDYYLEAQTIDKLFEKILKRYEKDYGQGRSCLVRDAMVSIWAARRGLTEKELIEILGADDEPLPQAIWAPLHLAADRSLVNRSGLINFAHDYLRQAVQNRYLLSEQNQKQAHLDLAEYFQSEKEITFRKIDELPWQYQQAEDWQNLYKLVSDLKLFDAIWRKNEFEVKAYWASVENNSQYRLVTAYQYVLNALDHFNIGCVWNLGTLLTDTGHTNEALRLKLYLVEYYRNTGDKKNLASSINDYAMTLMDRGDPDKAMKLYKEEERLFKEIGDKDGLRACLGNKANILFYRGDYDEAMKLHKESERISIEQRDKKALSISLGNQSVIHQNLGELDNALYLQKEQERICKELGDKKGFAYCLGNQSLILKTLGEIDEAMKLLKMKESLCKEMGDKDGLQNCLGNKAIILSYRGDYDEAMKLHKEEERLCIEIGNKDGLSASLGNQALILKTRGEYNEAMKLTKEKERLCVELGDKRGLATSLGIQASILTSRGEHYEAMKLSKDEERICRESGDKMGLVASLGNQVNILISHGKYDEAMKIGKEEERICKESGDKKGLAASLGNQAKVFKVKGEFNDALKLHYMEEQINRELGFKDELQECLGNQATILAYNDEFDKAMKLSKEKKQICCELGNKNGLSSSLGIQALIYAAHSDFDEAVKFSKEEEMICRELGNEKRLADCLDSQAVILDNQAGALYSRGELDKAMRLYKELEQIYIELGNENGLSQNLSNQQNILKTKDEYQKGLGKQGNLFYSHGKLDDAMRCFRQQEVICRELGNKNGLSISFGSQGNVLYSLGELDEALKLYKKEEETCHELGNKEGLHGTLNNQINILISKGELGEAMQLSKIVEQICVELGNKDALQSSIGNKGNILYSQGDYDGANKYYIKQEQICREIGNKLGLSNSLNNQANILNARSELDKAMVLYKEQESICRELGHIDGVARSLIGQASVHANSGQVNLGLQMAEKSYQLARQYNMGQLAEQLKPIYDYIKAMCENNPTESNNE